MKQLLREFKLDAIIGLDAETFYEAGSSGYSLKNQSISTTDYIIDPRFKMHCMSVQAHTWKKPRVLTHAQFKTWALGINWRRTGVLAHHAQFDGFIASHHYKIKPAAFFDTMSMGRPLLPITVGGSLDAMLKAFGNPGKEGGEALVAVAGKRDLTRAELKALMVYAGHDIEKTWWLFHKLREYMPIDELRLIDETVRMYTDPRLLVDKAAILSVRDADVANKQALVAELDLGPDYETGRARLASAPEFFALLQDAGIDPPTKVSVKKSESATLKAGRPVEIIVPAFSKQDQEFKDLASHEDPFVRQLMAARFAVTSSLMETRCTRLAERSRIGAQPVYLNYYGAKPGRWSGGDLVNWQNLSSKRKEGGAELRASVYAPPGYVMLIADLGQIEARLNAWDSGQQDKLDLFREGLDVYRYGAAAVYNKPVGDVTDGERFIGKTCDLALGYQAGAPRFARTLRIGAFGPALDITDSLAKDIHTAWRQTNSRIVGNWKITNNNLRSAFFGLQTIEQGAVTYEGLKGNHHGGIGYIHGPGGASIRYDGVKNDDEGIKYISEYFPLVKGGARIKHTRLYGGIIVQNKIEHLGRRLIADQMLELCAYLPTAKLVMSTHDEIVMLVPTRLGNKALSAAKSIMTQAPYWAPDLPLAVDAHISTRYDK